MAYAEYLKSTIKTVATLDFTSERKTMSTVVSGFESANVNTLILKGAPERVIEKSKNYKKEDGSLQDFTEADKKKFIEQIQAFAKEGLRVLGVGVFYGAGKLGDLNSQNIEQKLSDLNQYGEYETGGTFLGIVCIKDPVREEVK